MRNGFVFHTSIDTIEKIHAGTIQQYGENILSVLHNIVTKEGALLRTPSAHSNVSSVYYDFMGKLLSLISNI